MDGSKPYGWDPDMALLVQKLVKSRGEEQAEKPFGLYVIPGTSPYGEICRGIEFSVFLEVFNNSIELIEKQYKKYNPWSVHMLVIDHHRMLPAGQLRLIHYNPYGFVSLTDLNGEPWSVSYQQVLQDTNLVLNPAQVLDVTTFTSLSGYRGDNGAGVSLILLHGAIRYYHVSGSRWAVCILDDKVLEMLQIVSSDMLHPYKGVTSKPYLDSPSSTPVWADVMGHEYLLKVANNPSWNTVWAGEGLYQAFSLPDFDSMLFDMHPASDLPGGGAA